MADQWQPFTAKPKEEKAAYKRRVAKWEEKVEELENNRDISHRRFNVTLTPKQIWESFKECVRTKELTRDRLLNTYRVIAQEVLSDPDITDDEIISMHETIRARASEVYERRRKAARKVRW